MARGATPDNPLHEGYAALRAAAARDLRGAATGDRIREVAELSLRYLRENCEQVRLVSRVMGKAYFSFRRRREGSVLSRPVNRDLWDQNHAQAAASWRGWAAGRQLQPRDLARLIYTFVVGYCAASELFDRNNKKGPATYFECVVGHLVARELGTNPTKRLRLDADGVQARLTMDFLFDLGEARPKVHLPVKMSTRERVVQAWAHQRILDARYGPGYYRGILIVFSETKLNLTNREVVEICVPEQWLVYQAHLAAMYRIYYFDPPARYVHMARTHPVLPLADFSQFFAERGAALHGRAR
ncbi:MAG: hypothetical protein ACRD17_00515 [Terriglobales bacterium]